MRVGVTVEDAVSGRRVDAVLFTDPRHTIADLVPALLSALDAEGTPSAIHPHFASRVAVAVDGTPVPPTTAVRTTGIAAGAVITLHGVGPRLRELPGGVAEVRVVNGPGAGRIHRLALAPTPLGNGAQGISLPDLHVPADAGVVEAHPDGSVTITLHDVTGELDGVELPAGDTREWSRGALLRLAGTVMQLTAVAVADADARPSVDGPGLDVNRPPRLRVPDAPRAFALPREPREPVKRPLPWLVVVAPVLMVVPMWLIFGNWRFLFFAALTPLLAIANWLSDRRGSRKAYLADVRRHEEESAEVEERAAAALAEEARRRLSDDPDPAAVLLTALGPDRRLWERRRGDPDWLRLRVGLAERVAHTQVTPPAAVRDHREPPPPRRLRDVPAVIDLPAAGVVGVHGPHARRLAHWLLAQAAVHHAPRDLQVVCLLRAEDEDWNWVRWLPHCAGEGATPLVGVDQESTARRLGELASQVTARRATMASAGRGAQPPGPATLVVVDGARRLRALPAFVSLLRDGPAAGVWCLCLEEQENQLPQEARAVIDASDETAVRLAGAPDEDGISPDLVDKPWPDRVARALAGLRDVTPEEETGAGLPAAARLVEVLHLEPPDADTVTARWRAGSRTTTATIGIGFDGPFTVDLRRDGPHALVAGTTGSGKSELLQTWVAALAVANRPDDLTFVLVDYKGGSAFRQAAGLPHTVGLVTDLDEHLVSRALESLGAELKRRERLLAGPGAKDLEDYQDMRARDPHLPPIPRLVLVIDEFAGLVAELPDFVTGLVAIAQRGRSLGIHLVLATQRPSGVIGPDIRANTNLRICLRVTDEAESRDVLDAPDAARIRKDQPGRAFARSGAATLLPFQTARVGGRRRQATLSGALDPPHPQLVTVPWARLGHPVRPPARAGQPQESADAADTDLAAIVDALTTATRLAGIPRVPSPWLPALADVVTLADLPAPDDEEPGAPWALDDIPAEQARRAHLLRLGVDSALYVVGSARSGRTTALRTIVVTLAARHSPADLHVHVIDCGNGELLSLRPLPHVGAVVSRHETERADRLLERLAEEVASRQQELSRHGWSHIDEQRAAAGPLAGLPYIVLLIDRWEGFAATLGDVEGGRLTETVQQLLRDGAAVGLHVLVSGDRSLLIGRTGALVENKLVLRLADPADVTMAGLSRRQVPAHWPPGRGLWAGDGRESQVAVLDGDVSGAGQAAAVARLAEQVRSRHDVPADRLPWRLEVLPARVHVDEVLARPMPTGPRWLPLAVGGDDAEPQGVDLSASPVLLVAGPPRSGRTTTLQAIAAMAQARGVPGVAVLALRGGALMDAAGVTVLDAEAPTEELVERLRLVPRGGLVLVDDAEESLSGELEPLVRALVLQARPRGLGVVLAGLTAQLSTTGGWLGAARRERQGLLLSPLLLGDGDVLGVRLGRSMLAPRVRPGRGLLVRAGGTDVMPVQVPTV